MTESQKSKGINISKVAIIILLSLILLLTAAILFFVVSDNKIEGIIQIFKTDGGEFTASLDEFVVNLKPEGSIKHYLKVTLALMYTEEDHGGVIESSINKIRDAIITNIRTRTYGEVLDDTNGLVFKEDVKKSINAALGEDLIKDIYITDLIIQ